MAISYAERIPNNVDLGTDRTLQRALEHWQPKFLNWWKDLGPTDFQSADVYLRTATSVDSKGWATYGAVKMPDYRWGIFLAEQVPDRKIGFGDFFGQPVWQQVPGEHRSTLRRLIVTQGDTEPASVEQQRLLGHTCPSLYDLRSLFQINVEEGRHLWAMVYLLHAYFGRDGREEAEALLSRHSGYADNPRILNTFNEPIDDWLSLFMFTYFTDRDGKFQLKCLAESGFDPLSRTCRFMLTEEAYHMSVGLLGLGRVIQRTLEVMAERKTDDPEAIRRAGAIDLPTFQRYLNFWFSSSVDLFGAEISSNAATTFANGIKGRADEEGFPDHVATEATFDLEIPAEGGKPGRQSAPMRNALNEVVRHAYIRDCALGINRWNRAIQKAGQNFEVKLPNPRFNRTLGAWSAFRYDPDGNLLTQEQWATRKGAWLPSDGDRIFVKSLMHPVREPGKIAAWLAPPDKGVNGLDVNYEYVRL